MNNKYNEGCTCHLCNSKYKSDIIVPSEIWLKIKPDGSTDEGGLLCGTCIIMSIERLYGYSSWGIIKI